MTVSLTIARRVPAIAIFCLIAWIWSLVMQPARLFWNFECYCIAQKKINSVQPGNGRNSLKFCIEAFSPWSVVILAHHRNLPISRVIAKCWLLVMLPACPRWEFRVLVKICHLISAILWRSHSSFSSSVRWFLFYCHFSPFHLFILFTDSSLTPTCCVAGWSHEHLDNGSVWYCTRFSFGSCLPHIVRSAFLEHRRFFGCQSERKCSDPVIVLYG